MTIQISKQYRKEIINHYRMLLNSCRHIDNGEDIKLIRSAFELLLVPHKDLSRETGEPHLFHATAVAKIVAGEMGL